MEPSVRRSIQFWAAFTRHLRPDGAERGGKNDEKTHL